MTERTAVPAVVDRVTWAQERRALLAREKAHTREGDAIAAAWRRMPMAEVDARTILVGDEGLVPLLDVFAGRDQLVVYKHMWHAGAGIEGQCVGCTASIINVQDVSYLNHRGVSFAVFCEGPWEEIAPLRQFMGYELPWYSMLGVEDRGVGAGLIDEPGFLACYLRVGDRVFLTNEVIGRGVEAVMSQVHLLDLTVYGRQEEWEDSPDGWPQHATGSWWVRDGRPVPQWTKEGVPLNAPD